MIHLKLVAALILRYRSNMLQLLQSVCYKLYYCTLFQNIENNAKSPGTEHT